VEKNSERIELFYLPPYAPEVNPDELVWNHVKTRVGKVAAQTKEELIHSVKSALHRLQKLPDVVASFFHTPTCKYAAV
jgi:transposase